MNLSWTAATETGGTISQYLIERCTGAACSNFAQVGTSGTTTFNDTGLAASTSYSYRVRATDAANNFSSYSNTSTTATVAPSLTSPSNLAGTAAGPTQINLSWTAASETGGTISQYLIERCLGAGCSNFIQVGTSPTTTFNDAGLAASTSYGYRVRATDASNNLSAYSNTFSATTAAPILTAPANLTATAAGSTQINLSWTAATETGGTISQYLIERCTGAGCGNFAQVGTSAATTFTFNDTGLAASISYSYRVRATDAANNLSGYSNTSSATTAAPTMTAPANLTAAAAGPTQINLSWTAATETGGTISQYLIERCTGAACSNFAQVNTSATTAFNDTGLATSTSYSYRVRAADPSNNLSAYSNTSSATTTAPILTAPSNLMVTSPTPVVQAVRGYINSTFLTTHTTAPFDSSGGDLIVMCASSHAGVTMTPSDSFSNTWISAAGPTNTSTGFDLRTQVWYVKSPTVGPNHTFTLNLSASQSLVISVIVVRGSNALAPIDAISTIGDDAGSQTLNVSSPNITTTSANDLLIGFGKSSASETWTSGSGYIPQAAASSDFLDAETGLAVTPGTYNSTFSISNAATWQAVVVAVKPSASALNLSWTASNSPASNYLVERCQGAGCTNFVQIGTTAGTTYTDTGLETSTSYSYRVRATDPAGDLSNYSNVATATTPSGGGGTARSILATGGTPQSATINTAFAAPLQATVKDALNNLLSGVVVTFTAPASGASGTFGGGVNTTATTNASGVATSATFTANATVGGPYNVVASATGATSANFVLTNTAGPTFTAPSNLTATAAGFTQINLSWTAATETGGTISQYLIERCAGAGCNNFAPVGSSVMTTFNDTGLTPAISYSYRVRATDAANNRGPYSLTVTASTPASGIIVSISPKRAAVTNRQAQAFSAMVTGTSNTSVTWAVDGAPGGAAATGTIDANGNYTPPSTGGTHTITATSVADPTQNATASIAITDLSGVFTYHNDLSRDGANTHEVALTSSTVNTTNFGKLFSCPVDGAIYAQPLWVANLSAGGVSHNIIIVATQHDSVYAFDADASPCLTLWHANLFDFAHGAVPGETPVPSGPGGLVGFGVGDINPELGITGTPVIDPTTNILYVVSKSVSGTMQFFQRLHALDLTNGNEKLNGNKPVVISATVAGTGDGSLNGQLAFDPQNQNQRAGLALVNGMVYIAWGSHEDKTPYHGWMMAYDAASLAFIAAFNTTPNGGLGGIWMAGAAPAVDSNGNCFLATGNGTFNGLDEYGDTIVKLGPPSGGAFSVLDFFTPTIQATLSSYDLDVGSGGVLLLPDLSGGAHPHLLVEVAKNGTMYLVDRDNGKMGEYCNACSADSVVQELPNAVNGMWGMPAYWNGNLYVGGALDGTNSGDNLKAFSFNAMGSGLISASPTSKSLNTFYYSGPTPSVSSNGGAGGIVWALDNSQFGPQSAFPSGPAVLHAYDATNLQIELWNSSQTPGDQAGNAVKFTVPTIANGKVYIGTRGNSTTNGGVGELDVYGLKPN
ncbi:MAG TPA: fibronectin type III domain-containing protein [Candidatus Acidoferrum sp.]|nr:fibronectin type III domain-containing protein [Candidatus Acidoferrum sp.]